MDASYNFDDQLRHGERGETFLDRFFARWFRIEPADHQEQRSGIDRFYYDLSRPRVLAVEYKTDETASRTGNAFIETISVDSMGRSGWAYTSRADVLMYYLPRDRKIYVLQLANIRQQLPLWRRQYPLRQIRNRGYFTHGLLVPLKELDLWAEAILFCD
jgi:hypothetical protein